MSDIIVTNSDLPPVEGLQLHAVMIPSTLDGAPQPVIIGVPDRPAATPTPLLVGLHTWSADYRGQTQGFGPLCARYGWLMVLPNFRGPNLTSNPEPRLAGGSLAAQRDIVDAVAHMRQQYPVDERRIYLLGGSGGGHMSLLMAGKHPDPWAGVSSWCPITSLQEWHEQQNGYAVHVEAVCGGAPGDTVEVAFEYERRSPRTFITNAANTNVRISHGDNDRCIYIAQTWRTYERLLDLPHRVEFYSWSGGHDLVAEWGFEWLAQQVKPDDVPRQQTLVTDEGKWYGWLYLEPDSALTFARCAAVLGEDGVLDLTVEHSGRTQVRLADLPVGPLVGAEREGRPVVLETLAQADGVVQLPPCAQPTHWRLSCDAQAAV
jgi:poly(3-hydroxybutyrate) depolymerase